MDAETPEWLHDLTEVTKALGEPAFVDHLMRLLNRIVPVDHCAVFTFSPEGRAEHLFTQSKMPKSRAERLASDYIGGYFADDPHFATLAGLRQGASATTEIIPLDPKGDYDPAYRQHFFEQNDLIDKASIAAAVESGVVYCNFYRMGGSGRYSPEDWRRLTHVLPLVTSLIAAHYKMRREQAAGSHPPGGGARSLIHSVIGRAAPPFDRLTAREREVCARVLLGFTTEAIALDLGVASSSVTTYRKRAYHKLGVATQNELFSLCLATIERMRAPAAG